MNEPNEYIIQRANDALVSDPRIGELGIHIGVIGEEVFVEGLVATEERRAAIGEVLTRLLPNHTVHNEVEIEKIHEPSTPEELT